LLDYYDNGYQVFSCGMSQNPDTKVYILVFNDDYLNYYCKICGNKYESSKDKWCKPCQINKLKDDFTNWTSGNEKIDNFIQKKQLEFINDEVLFEWIPYNKIVKVEEIGDNCLTTAIWKDGPLYYKRIECRRKSYEKVCLKFLHNSQDINDEFLIEVLEFSINLNDNIKIILTVFVF
jgi:hypothetical protein